MSVPLFVSAEKPGSQAKAFQAVLDAANMVDAKHGTRIMADFWINLIKGNFTAYP